MHQTIFSAHPARNYPVVTHETSLLTPVARVHVSTHASCKAAAGHNPVQTMLSILGILRDPGVPMRNSDSLAVGAQQHVLIPPVMRQVYGK